MKIVSIQVGLPKIVKYQGREILTGIYKKSVPGPVMLRFLNLEGDGQADLKVHGGKDKALYAYGIDAYLHWKKLRPLDSFPNGAMGENLSLTSLKEDSVYVGDIYQVGKARVQVTQPRLPCTKLAMKFEDPIIINQFNQNIVRPGVYFRVLEEGLISTGDEFVLQFRENVLLSILEFFSFAGLNKPLRPDRRKEILTIPSLTEKWREKLSQ